MRYLAACARQRTFLVLLDSVKHDFHRGKALHSINFELSYVGARSPQTKAPKDILRAPSPVLTTGRGTKKARVYRERAEGLSAEEQALRQHLSTSQLALDSLQAELSVLKSTLDARTAALASAETARDGVNAAATAAAEDAAAREEDLTSELAALRAVAGDAPRELEREVS